MKERGFIQYIVLIAFVLGIAFLSQQPLFKPYGKNLYNQASIQASLYWSKANNWVTASLYPKATQEVQNRGEPLQEAIIDQKNNFAQNVWENIKNYFAEKFSKISGTQVK